MLIATVSGNLGQDAETREAGDNTVTNFSVASNSKVKGEKITTWIRCSIWGLRGEKLAPYLTRGTKVTVVGELSAQLYNEKIQLNLRVDQLDLMGGGGEKKDKKSESQNDEEDPFK